MPCISQGLGFIDRGFLASQWDPSCHPCSALGAQTELPNIILLHRTWKSGERALRASLFSVKKALFVSNLIFFPNRFYIKQIKAKPCRVKGQQGTECCPVWLPEPSSPLGILILFLQSSQGRHHPGSLHLTIQNWWLVGFKILSTLCL